MRVSLWLGGALLTLLLLSGGIVWWAGSEGSLSRALHIAQRWLPGDQQLVFSDAQGSITGGGHIGHLQWSKPGITLIIEDLRLDWSLRQLLSRELRVRTLSAKLVQARLTPQPDKPDEPFTMPADVSLPIRLDVPLNIARVQIDNIDEQGTSSTQVLDGIAARYQYDGTHHSLRLSSLHYGQSSLQANAQLHARDLTLAARVSAALRNLTPDTPFAMQAELQANGTLAGADAAQLEVQLDARQQDVAAADAAQVRAQAKIHPWRRQPAQQVDLQLAHLNAHAFQAQAPVTALRGQASVQPEGSNAAIWNAVADFTNDRPGAWDKQLLPLRRLTAGARLSLEQVDIETVRAELGGGTPAGAVAVQGKLPLKQLAQTTLQLDLQKVDLRPLMTTLPRTAFTGPISVRPGQQNGWQAQADIRNTLPGPFDREQLPLDRLLADLRITPQQWHIETFDLQLGTGRMQVRGDYAPRTQALDMRGELQRLPLRQIHRKMGTTAAAQLSGKFGASGSLRQRLTFEADMASDAPAAGAPAQRGQWEIRSLQTKGSWSPTRLTIERLHADAFQAKADGNDIDVVLPGFDSVKARLTAEAPGVKLSADAAMLQQSGGGKLAVELSSAEQVVAWLRGLPFVGEQLPQLRATGAATLNADWQGGWRQWIAGFRNPASQPKLHLNAVAHSDGLHITAPAVAGQPPTRIDVQKLNLDVQGNLVAASLAIEGDARANDTHALLDMRMKTTQVRGTGGAPRWDIAVDKFTASATLPDQTEPWRLQLSDNLQITAQTGANIELRATAGSATLSAPSSVGAEEPLKVAWQPMLWRRTARGANTVQSTGTITGIQPAWLDVLLAEKGKDGPLTGAGMHTDLMLSGDWDVRMTDRVNIRAHLKRERGDLSLVDADTSAGIRAFDVQVQAADENVNLALNWDTERAGVITARIGTRLKQQSDGWSLPDNAPLSGSVQAKLQDLSTWAFLAPPGWRIQGNLDANVQLAGTVQKPLLTGGIDGKGLNVRSVLDGVDLYDGTLHATLNDSRMEIGELTFQGGTGSRAYVRGISGNRTSPPADRGRMTAKGSIDWSGVANASEAESGIVMDLNAELTRMQVLVRHDRQMTLSGKLAADLKQGALRVRGDIRVDRATIVLPEASAPTLGDDVVIVRNKDLKNPSAVEARQARTELDTRKPMDMEVKLDLGRDLALEGQGITTRLEGELTVRSNARGSDPFSVFGEVRTTEGRYRAWGQALDVETGVVRFNGSYINPTLDLLAIRPKIDVRAGVRVTGTLLAPRVQLYSDPDLPEGEKLSWVVLGRATVVTGAEGSSMQQAALGLAAGQLGGKLASGLGLDELGFGDAGVSVGKRISNELYLTYQQGLSGAASTLFIFYDITRRLTVRAQTGEASAVDLVYTITFD
ncbi:MAG TPA: translocation/assembly module TamB domain-containing protein [Steroidobacteraceae bacterium]|nr:translocation/assembly module TamB domain-containing protein [Steroidobacteraceae bacterium]